MKAAKSSNPLLSTRPNKNLGLERLYAKQNKQTKTKILTDMTTRVKTVNMYPQHLKIPPVNLYAVGCLSK